jgi:hypothetical protein
MFIAESFIALLNAYFYIEAIPRFKYNHILLKTLDFTRQNSNIYTKRKHENLIKQPPDTPTRTHIFDKFSVQTNPIPHLKLTRPQRL